MAYKLLIYSSFCEMMQRGLDPAAYALVLPACYKGARMSLVSVLIPAFNAATTIGATIDSVLSQTLQDFEIIVSDDGSTDSTALVVSRYRSDPRVHYLFHENRGTSHAKNLAAR